MIAIEAARRLPEIPFVMIANSGDDEVERTIRASLPTNVTLVDYVPHDQMPSRFHQARLFLSTGSAEHEGFPNILLEAAAAGVPTVAMSDFDNFLLESDSGVAAEENIDVLVQRLRWLWTDREQWRRHASAGRRFVQERHHPQRIVDAFVGAVKGLVERS